MKKYLTNSEVNEMKATFKKIIMAKKSLKNLKDENYEKYTKVKLALEEAINIYNNIKNINIGGLFVENSNIILKYFINNGILGIDDIDIINKYFVVDEHHINEDKYEEFDYDNVTDDFYNLFNSILVETNINVFTKTMREIAPDHELEGDDLRVFGGIQKDLEEWIGEPRDKNDESDDDQCYYYDVIGSDGVIVALENIMLSEEFCEKFNNLHSAYSCGLCTEIYSEDNRTYIVLAISYLVYGITCDNIADIIIELRRVIKNEPQRYSRSAFLQC